jgi:enolase
MTEHPRRVRLASQLKGLAKFWADGKRPLTINEIADLSNDDKDIYNRWQKRKKGKKTEKDRERDYAVKAAKKERTMELIKTAVKEAVAAAAEPTVAAAIDVAKAKEKELLAEDMTGTLKPLGTYALENLARDAYKAAVKAKKDEL